MFLSNVPTEQKQFQWSDQMDGCCSLKYFIGEGNAGVIKAPISDQFPTWRHQASKFQKGGIIAGGDGSAKYQVMGKVQLLPGVYLVSVICP